MKTELKLATIEFVANEVKYKFEVVHDMPNTFGLSLKDAVHNWVSRTDSFKLNSLIKYINSKEPNVFIMSADKYEKLNGKIEFEDFQ